MAPFTPFLAEELYHKLTGGESVHLLDWPEAGRTDASIIARMDFVKRVVNEGLSLRAKAGIKVRQPLQVLTVSGMPQYEPDQVQMFLNSIIMDELNVKELSWDSPGEFMVELDLEITPELKREGLIREVVRQVQNARKEAGLQVDDRINLVLTTDDKELEKAIDEHAHTIQQETLTLHLTKEGSGNFETTAKVEGSELVIKLEKAV